MKDNICVIFNIGVNQRKVWYIIIFLNWLLKKVSQINENLKKFFHVTKSIENWYKLFQLQIKANIETEEYAILIFYFTFAKRKTISLLYETIYNRRILIITCFLCVQKKKKRIVSFLEKLFLH